jgi:hypothetical protein
MGYLQEVERWLDGLLQGFPPERLAEAKKEIKAKILESYRNGQGLPPEPQREAPRRPAPSAGRERRYYHHGR